jgi:serine/threonine protein kinase
MAEISHHQFISLLKRSNVVDPKKLQEWLGRKTRVTDARMLAKKLVRDGLLTTWQAKFLLSGRHRLRIGNYHLLTRMRRDEFGARYLAIHATLARKVELQIFTKDLTGDTDRWNELIKKATSVAELDHPGLVHVYDIDHDGDRYYLVVEHISGQPLDVSDPGFSVSQIGRLVLECVDSIQFAHKSEVIHGTIEPSDLLITDEGAVKIQNLTVSPLRNLNVESPEPTVADDFSAISGVGEKLLQVSEESETNAAENLKSVLVRLKTADEQAVNQLREWVGEHQEDAGGNETTSSGAHRILPPQLSPSRRASDQINPSDSVVDPDNLYDEGAISSSVSLIEDAKSSLPLLIALGVGLMLLGGIMVFGLMRVMNKYDSKAVPPKKKSEKAVSKNLKAEDVPPAVKTAGFESPVVDQQIEPDRQVTKADDSANVESGSAAKPSSDDVEVSKDKGSELEDSDSIDLNSIFGSDPLVEEPAAGAKSSTMVSAASKQQEADDEEIVIPPAEKETADKLSKVRGIGDASEKVLKAAGVRTFGQLSKMTAEHLDKVFRDAGVPKSLSQCQMLIDGAASLAANSSGGAGKPSMYFSSLPEAVSLPSVDSVDQVKLAEVKIPSHFLMKTTIVSPEGIGRRSVFEMRRTEEDKQAWLVSVKRKKNASQGKDVAKFQKTADALNFQWLPAAAKEKSAAFLKNCLIEVSTPDDQSKLLMLREPITAPALKLTKQSIVDQLKLEIDALPDAERLQISLMGFAKGDPPLVLVQGDVGRQPAIVSFRETEKTADRFLSLQVAAVVKPKAITLKAGLVGRTPSAGSQLIGNPQQLMAFRNQLLANAKNKDGKPSVTKRKQVEDCYASVDRLITGAGGAGEPINFEIVAEFDGLRVVLVKSNGNVVREDSKK